MALVTINEEYLEDIAEAIRTKNGTNETLRPKDMAAAIEALQILPGPYDQTFMISLYDTKIHSHAYYGNILSPVYTKIGVEKPTLGRSHPLDDMGQWAFARNPNITEVDLSNCDRLKIIGDKGDTSQYGSYAFDGCSNLTSVTLPPNLEVIGRGAFSQCSKLESITLPSTLTTISSSAFECSGLISVMIPASVTRIGDKEHNGCSFAGCENLRYVYFKGTPNQIDDTTFYLSNNISLIYVPWSEGAVAGAPWGATNATIIYNSIF